jgi:hypothetical protein
MKNKLHKIKEWIQLKLITLYYRSIWGKAMVHLVFDEYKESPLFYYRRVEVGTLEASEMFSLKEYRFFKNRVKKDRRKMFTFIFFPFIILNRLSDKDLILKKNIRL